MEAEKMDGFTITINVHAPELTAAINKLVEAVQMYGATSLTIEGPVPAEMQVETAHAEMSPVIEETTVAADPSPVAPVETVTTVETGPARTAISRSDVPADDRVYTLEEISNAGLFLLDAGKKDDLIALLNRCNAQAITQLKPEQYAEIAVGLRALGASI